MLLRNVWNPVAFARSQEDNLQLVGLLEPWMSLPGGDLLLLLFPEG